MSLMPNTANQSNENSRLINTSFNPSFEENTSSSSVVCNIIKAPFTGMRYYYGAISPEIYDVTSETIIDDYKTVFTKTLDIAKDNQAPISARIVSAMTVPGIITSALCLGSACVASAIILVAVVVGIVSIAILGIVVLVEMADNTSASSLP